MIKITEINTEGETKTIERTYDSMNRVETYTDCNGKTVKYGYDELGNIVSLTYAGGEIVRYSYTDNGLLEAVVDGEGYKTSYTYDSSGRLLTAENPDGTVETNTYDGYGRLASTTLEASGEELYTISYTYDQWGNILTISCEGEGAEDAGISTLTPATMTYDESNRMLTYNGEDITYDEDGNMTYGPLDGEMTTFEYDCRNRLIRAGETTYEYDAEDVRIAVETPEYRDEYVTDTVTALSRVLEVERTYKDVEGQDSQTGTGNSDAVVKSVYYYGNGLIYEKNSEDGLLVYHYDHLGSTKAVTNKDGNIIAKFSYGTYGELLTDKTEYSTIVPEIRFLYNGELGVITDDNSLYYMRARYYNPQIKRFINQDILTGNIGNNKSLNRYSYVEGNPVSYTDPFGLSPIHFILDVAGIFFPPADLLNAGLYLLEGNYKEAAKSVIYSIPGYDVYGLFAKFSLKAGKCGKYIDTAADIITYGGYAGSIALGAYDTGTAGGALIDKYLVNGEEVSAETILKVAVVVASGAQTGFSAHYYNKYLNVPDSPKISTSNIPSLSGKATSITQKITSNINDSLFLKALCDNSGKIDFDVLLGKKGDKNITFGEYRFKEGIDIDLRGKGTYKEALEMAFKKVGIPKENFNITKWGKDKYGKSFPVEWRANNGAEVNIDIGHSSGGGAPNVPHVGWQTGGKRGLGGAVRGHIFVDDVPYNR